jgi:very-short-patch-repair endonuclease
MRSTPECPVFSRADARACGWSDAALSRAVQRGRLHRVRRNQFTALPPDPRLAAVAAVRGCGGSVASHRSAALLHGLPLVGAAPAVPDVTVPPRGTGDLHLAHLCRATLRPEDVVFVDDVPVTSVPRTIIDLGRHRPMATMVAAADFAVHEGLTTLEQLGEVLAFCANWPRASRAARALAQVDGRAESPLESISRLAFSWLRLPAPVLQQRIRDDHGIVIARTDFYWDEFGVVGEADGKIKLKDWDYQIASKAREEGLEDLGLEVVRWGWTDIVQLLRSLEARIRRAFDRGQRRDALGFPRRWSLAAA